MGSKDTNTIGMDYYKGEEPPEKPSNPCCTASRGQCIIVVVVFVALVAIIAVLGGLLGTKEDCSESDAVTEPTPVPDTKLWENHRLPTHIVPLHYDLTLFPDFYDGHDSFTGNVTITLNITMATRYILVHIRDLTVTRTKLMRDGTELVIKTPFHYAENEFWVVETDHIIAEGEVQLEMEFGGSLVNGIVGLYKSTYVNSTDNTTKYIATSKFQPTDARKAFPCLDEPGLKSTFTTTLIHRPEMTALSNMPEVSRASYGVGLVATHFNKSVPMVTYLKCFIVCDFKYLEGNTSNGVPFKVWATPDKVSQVQYALDVGVKILDKYETYYGLPYPLPKMDMIAIPDFVSGAMEHWGLITYRETNLLYDEKDASISNKQRVAVVIAHELAHMWFGNLVTMEWWDDLWLNEGFASFVEYLGVAHVEKEWDMEYVFVSSDLQKVMPDDSKISSHPIIVPVDHPSEITEVFDSISYSKGASVLRMLDSFMGTEKFQEGLQAYMRKYEYKTTVTDDLWAALEEFQIDGAPRIKTIMDTWTRQMGFPVVTVSSIQGSKITLTQERFLLDPEADKTQPPSEFKYKWRIPIRYQTDINNSSSLLWMNDAQLTIDTQTDLTAGWVKLNVRQEGYYRVNYPDDMWRRLAKELDTNHEALLPSDRSGLIDDIFNLASAKMSDMSIALDLIKYMEKERHLVPWTSVERRLDYITEMMVTGMHFEKWQTFVRGSASSVLQDIATQTNLTDLDRQLRGLVISLACGHGDKNCLNDMQDMFTMRLNGTAIDPNIRSSVYRFGMQALGDETAWDYMWNEYNMATVPQEKRLLLYAVTQTREPWLIHRLLAYSMDHTIIRDQDFFTMITYLSWNRVAHPIVWNFARSNWEALVDRFDIDNRYLGRMVPGIVNYFNTESQQEEVKDFFAKYPDAGAGARAREQALEQIQTNIVWMEANEDTIVQWLNANVA